MSYRRSSPPGPRDGGGSSSYGRGGYSDRRPPPREYRDSYEARGPRRSVSPPRARGAHPRRDARDGYDGRRDRDYPREGPPPARDERGSRHAGPPAPREDEYSRRKQASPPRRVDRERWDGEGRGRSSRAEGEPSKPRREAVRSRDEEAKKAERDQDEDEDGEADDDLGDDAEQDLMASLGFGGFGTTKNTKVEGNQLGAAEVKKERTWRQYMQRKGGFNRPLSPVRKG